MPEAFPHTPELPDQIHNAHAALENIEMDIAALMVERDVTDLNTPLGRALGYVVDAVDALNNAKPILAEVA